MYKRRARVVFLTGYTDGLADQAVLWVNELAVEWMEARVVRCDTETLYFTVENQMDLNWADLWVSLDERARQSLPVLRPGVQHRHYPFEQDADNESMRWQALRERILGMVGGMRLLSRAE